MDGIRLMATSRAGIRCAAPAATRYPGVPPLTTTPATQQEPAYAQDVRPAIGARRRPPEPPLALPANNPKRGRREAPARLVSWNFVPA